MNGTELATGVGRSPCWWERLLLGLVCLGGLIVLLDRLPRLPALPWVAVQPTGEDLIRTWGVVAVWLALGSACVIAGWLAVRPVRRERALEPRPVKPSRRLAPQRGPSGPTGNQDLLALFATPRLRPETATTAPQPDPVSDDVFDGRGQAQMPSTGPLMLRLFGPLVIDGSTDQDGLRERATRGLIAFLALKRAPASLDELSEALWPGESPAKTRPRLWKAKRQAQRLLGDALLRRGDTYELDRKHVRIDADELDAHRTEERDGVELEKGLRLIAGEPLADVDYPWADGERRRLQAIQADLFARGAAARLDVGDGRGALEVAERLIDSDSLNEQGWRIAMEAEAQLGQRQAVLDRFERLRSELDERLGLRPQAATVETYHRLLGQA